MSRTIWHHVNGKTAESRSNRFGDVYNPATGEVQARVSLASKAEVNPKDKNAVMACKKDGGKVGKDLGGHDACVIPLPDK